MSFAVRSTPVAPPRTQPAHGGRRPHGAAIRWLLIGLIVLTGCAPQAPGANGTPRQSTTSGDPQRTNSERPLLLGLTNEPPAIAGKFAGGRSGLQQYVDLFAAQLVRYDYQKRATPQLAVEVPSLERGSWRSFDDGRMETTYRIRDGVKWHDGTPLTAEDFVFTWTTIMDPALPAADREPERRIESMTALDPSTVVIRWNGPYIYADAYETQPLPRHILEPLYQRDPQAFVNAEYWTSGWVGLGPYQLTEWVPGSYLKGRAFDGYVLGRPKINEVQVFFIADANQAVARVLGGQIDLTLGSLIKIDEGVVLRDQWEGRGEGKIVTNPASLRIGEFQFREPTSLVRSDVRVRKALAHGLDRQLIADTLHYGLTMVAHAFVSPDDGILTAANASLTKYNYDPNRALALLSEAGWTRGGDGSLRNARGERFEFGLRSLDTAQYVKEAQVVAEQWQQIGVSPELDFYGRARQNDREYRAKFSGIAFGSPDADRQTMTNYSTREMANDATGWRGGNRGGYSNPTYDGLMDQYFTTIDPNRRNDPLVRLLALFTDDLPGLPLYYPVDVYAIRNGLQGVVPNKPGEIWETGNVHLFTWDR